MSKLKHFRNRADLTQKELGVLCGFKSPQTRIALYETGGRTPTLIVSRQIVAALNKAGEPCSLDDVFPPQTVQLQAS